MKNPEYVVQKIIDYIEKNLEEDLNLDTISKDIGYSKFYLNRVFTEYTGITIHRYLQNRRLAVAAEKLAGSDKPILQIAYEAGYDSQQSFSYAFKRVYLYSPKKYRERGILIPGQDRIMMRCSYLSKHYKHITGMEELAA